MIKINDIYHHGIKGQKWGVRRFQRKDGSLTSVGKERYYDDDEKIKKGTKIYRVTNQHEPIDQRRKYVSITDNDRRDYKNNAMLGGLPIDYTESISEFTYKAKKDLRVVSGQRVVNDILSLYGDETTTKIVKDYMSGKYDKFDDDIKNTAKLGVECVYESFMRNHNDEIISRYIQQGYDAMVDPTDWVGGIAEYPVILLDPSSSVKKKRETSLT